MNNCICQSYQGLTSSSLLIARPGVQLQGVMWYGGDVPKVGCLTLSVLQTTSEGDWMLMNFLLCFLWTGIQDARIMLRLAMFYFNLKDATLIPVKANYTQQ